MDLRPWQCVLNNVPCLLTSPKQSDTESVYGFSQLRDHTQAQAPHGSPSGRRGPRRTSRNAQTTVRYAVDERRRCAGSWRSHHQTPTTAFLRSLVVNGIAVMKPTNAGEEAGI